MEDLFYAHIAGMDTFARGLKIAAKVRADGRIAEFVKQRYSSWDSGIWASKIEKGKATFADCEARALKLGDIDDPGVGPAGTARGDLQRDVSRRDWRQEG